MADQIDPSAILQAIAEGLKEIASAKRADADRLARYYGYEMAKRPGGDHELLREQVVQADNIANQAQECCQLAVGYLTGLYVVRPKDEPAE